MFGIEKKEPKQQKGWRIAASLAAYVELRAKDMGRGAETEIIEDCIGLHMTLEAKLKSQRDRIARYALDAGLGTKGEHDAIAQLVIKGLDAHEAKLKR